MVRASLFSVAIASSLIVGAVAAPHNSFDQQDNFERDFDLVDDLDLASRHDMSDDLAVREPILPFIGLIGGAIAKSIAARKAKKAAQKAAQAAGGAPPKRGKKGKREFFDEDEELIQRADDLVEFFTRYLEDSDIEGFERRGWAGSESLEALD